MTDALKVDPEIARGTQSSVSLPLPMLWNDVRTSKKKSALRAPFHCISKASNMVTPCYRYMDGQWFWFESGVMKPWEDGWKRPPSPTAKNRDPRWLDNYPGRPTGL